MNFCKKLIVCFLAALLLGTACFSAFALEYPCEGVANASSVRVRKKASTSGAQLTTLKKGEVVTVLEETIKENGDVRYKIETAKGKTGYVLSDYLSVPEKELIEAAEKSSKGVKMQLKITASCKDYNSVGKNWTHYYEWNGIKVEDGKMEAFVAPGVDLAVYARVREQDQKPETTTEKTYYTPTAEEVKKGFTVTQKIKVTENAGRFSGNSATWTSTYTFSPVKK